MPKDDWIAGILETQVATINPCSKNMTTVAHQAARIFISFHVRSSLKVPTEFHLNA